MEAIYLRMRAEFEADESAALAQWEAKEQRRRENLMKYYAGQRYFLGVTVTKNEKTPVNGGFH